MNRRKILWCNCATGKEVGRQNSLMTSRLILFVSTKQLQFISNRAIEINFSDQNTQKVTKSVLKMGTIWKKRVVHFH